MTILTEGFTPGHFLASEAQMWRSRDAISMSNAGGSEATFPAGLVLSRVAAGTATAAAKSGGNTGNATISAVTVGPNAIGGVYQVRFTAATVFTLSDPFGVVIATGGTGVAVADDLGFTITAGGTPMVAGDGFDITLVATAGTYVPFTNALGRPAVAVLWGAVTVAATSTADATAVTRDAELVDVRLQYDPTLTSDALTAAKAAARASLAAVGLIPR